MTRHLLLASLLLAGSGIGQTTLINATFDGVSNDTNPGFQIISNTKWRFSRPLPPSSAANCPPPPRRTASPS